MLDHKQRHNITQQLDKLHKKQRKHQKLQFGDILHIKSGSYIRTLQGWYRI